jgi:hypothetical protein
MSETRKLVDKAKSDSRTGGVGYEGDTCQQRFSHSRITGSSSRSSREEFYAAESTGRYLEPLVQVMRFCEALVVGSIYAKALRYRDDANLHFRINWSGLKGRKLVDRTGVRGGYFFAQECRDKEVSVDLVLPIQAAEQEIILKSTEAIQELARAFGGYLFPREVAERQANAFLIQMQPPWQSW